MGSDQKVLARMATGFWTHLMLLLSLVTGTAALTLCLLTWEILRESAIGRTVGALTVVMALFSVYHGIELLTPQGELFTSVLKSITFTGVALFVGITIRFERQMTEDTGRGES